MTNSPPPNVKHGSIDAERVLANGIDSLALAINVLWSSDASFQELARLKERAKSAGEDEPAVLSFSAGGSSWVFNVKPHGAGGYEWILTSRELTMKIGNWRFLKQRPNIMVDIRSETLWTYGPDAVQQRVRVLLDALGAIMVSVKPSRVDLCSDMLIRSEDWSLGLLDCFVTRAQIVSPWIQRKVLSGFTIGSGVVLARLYDKALEIRMKSHKTWMYDIWGIDAVPDECLVIRVEFQIRREALHNFKCDSWDAFKDKLPRLWAYCTKKWLRVVDDAALHHTQQNLTPWWSMVAWEFCGVQSGEPLVREKAIQQDIRQLAAQTLGTLSSIATILANDADIEGDILLDERSCTEHALKVARGVSRLSNGAFTERVKKKRAKYSRRPASASQKQKNRARVNRALNDEGEIDDTGNWIRAPFY